MFRKSKHCHREGIFSDSKFIVCLSIISKCPITNHFHLSFTHKSLLYYFAHQKVVDNHKFLSYMEIIKDDFWHSFPIAESLAGRASRYPPDNGRPWRGRGKGEGTHFWYTYGYDYLPFVPSCAYILLCILSIYVIFLNPLHFRFSPSIYLSFHVHYFMYFMIKFKNFGVNQRNSFMI